MELQESDEILDAQTQIWNHIFTFIKSASLKCAVDLGIAEAIQNHDGQKVNLDDLVKTLNINPKKSHNLGRLMRVLTTTGIFSGGPGSGYALAGPSRLLLHNHPYSMAPFVLGATSNIFAGPWHRVAEWFRNDDTTPYYTAYGETFWEGACRDEAVAGLFNRAMASDTRVLMALIIKKCRGVFEGLSSLVDVGGGTGTMARALAEEFGEMECTVFDLPHVVAGLEGTKNLAYVAGDMFQAVPPAQAVFLKWVLHDWNDEDCVKILKNCKEAIPNKENGGKVIIVDMVMETTPQNGCVDDDQSIQNQIFMDLQMMVYYGGQERSLKDLVKIFHDAGFTDYKAIPLGYRYLIQLFY